MFRVFAQGFCRVHEFCFGVVLKIRGAVSGSFILPICCLGFALGCLIFRNSQMIYVYYRGDRGHNYYLCYFGGGSLF